MFFCDRRRDRAGCIRIPRQFELTRRALRLFTVCGGAANKALGKIRRRSARRRRQRALCSEGPERGCSPKGTGKD
jgi:hypothetical protein